MLVRIVLAATLIAIATPALAQETSPRGTEFWFAFIENVVAPGRPPEPNEMLRVDIAASDQDAQCRLEIPSAGWSADVTVAARTAASIVVPSALAVSYGSENIEGRGLHLTATAPVTVTAINHMTHGLGDATIVLPVEGLGRDYVVATYDALTLGVREFPAEFIVVATDDATTVEVTPSVQTRAGRPAGIPFNIVLNRGESYQVQAHDNLSGTRVRTIAGTPCDRIAVFAGNLATQVDSCNSIDHLYEQMLPVRALEREYLMVPFAMRPGGDIVDVIALDDSTLILHPVGAPTVLNARERLRMRIDSAARIIGTKPIIVMQYARGRECDSAFEGDPHSVQLRPIGVMSSVDFVAPGSLTFNRHFITVSVPTSSTASVLLDGVPLTGFVSFNDLDLYSWAQTTVGPGPHRLTGSGLASAVLYGFGEAISYGVDLSATNSIVPLPEDVPITTRCLCEGVVLEAPSGYARYQWSNGDSTRMITARTTGVYTVTVAGRGCSVSSAPTRVVVNDRRSSITLAPNDSIVRAGDVIPFTLVARDRDALPSSCPTAYDRIALRFRSNVLAPMWMRGAEIFGDSIADGDRIMTLALESDTVFFDMVVALGDTNAASIILNAMGVDSCMRSARDTLARFALDGCDVGGQRKFFATGEVSIKPVRPLPVRGAMTVSFSTNEMGWTRLELIDARGLRVATLTDEFRDVGEHVAELETSVLSPGVYMLVLHTPSRELARMIVID